MYFFLLVYFSTQNFRECCFVDKVVNLTGCRQFVGHVVQLETVRILRVYTV